MSKDNVMFRDILMTKLANAPEVPALPIPTDLYSIGGTAIGGTAGALIGAGLGQLVSDNSYHSFANIPIPGTKRLENNEGRLIGGALGAALGGYAGNQMGADAARQATMDKIRKQRMAQQYYNQMYGHQF